MKLSQYFRIMLLKARGWTIGKNTIIERGASLHAKKGIIGENVYIGKGTRIYADEIDIGDNCLFFSNVDIMVTNSFRIGNRGKISRNTTIRAHNVTIGIELWCNENVAIGGGGWQKKTAILSIGDSVHIGTKASINVCSPVEIGSFTGIGIEAMIFTHSSGNGQSILEGYKHIEKPVYIGNHVSLFTRCFVCPGSVIEDYVTVAAMSFISGETEERGFYAGIPAKLKKKAFPLAEGKKLFALFKFLSEELIQYPDIQCQFDSEIIYVYQNTIHKDDTMDNKPCNVAIVLKLKPNLNASAVFVISENLLVGTASYLSELIRDKLRRLGIVFRYSSYTPFLLNYLKLIQSGIEEE